MSQETIKPFKCEHALFEMLKDGTKPFEMRRWDLSDARIYRLCWFSRKAGYPTYRVGRIGSSGRPVRGALPSRYQARTAYGSNPYDGYEPEARSVSFVDKTTGEVLEFEYRGVEFTDWAPGWGFIILGNRVEVGG